MGNDFNRPRARGELQQIKTAPLGVGDLYRASESPPLSACTVYCGYGPRPRKGAKIHALQPACSPAVGLFSARRKFLADVGAYRGGLERCLNKRRFG